MRLIKVGYIFGLALLTGCASGFSEVQPGSLSVASSSLTVRPSVAWNKAPKGPMDVKYEENWTQNGPLLDSIRFIGGLPEGEAITKQKKKAEQKVPTFQADMTPPDLVSMIESYYRIARQAPVFNIEDVSPVSFLDQKGIQIDAKYVGRDEVERRARLVLAIKGRELYMMALDAAALHYFDAAAPEFEIMVQRAKAD